MPQRLLTPTERVAARVVTGPSAHFVAGALDWLELAARLLRGSLRGRS